MLDTIGEAEATDVTIMLLEYYCVLCAVSKRLYSNLI